MGRQTCPTVPADRGDGEGTWSEEGGHQRVSGCGGE
jgi:hypothetical protein